MVLVDGEHYPPVVAAALEGLRRRYQSWSPGCSPAGARSCAAARARRSAASPPSSGCPRLDAVDPVRGDSGRDLGRHAGGLRAARAAVLVDLSDEPVVGYRERFLLMSAALAEGARYEAADTEVRPQEFARLGRHAGARACSAPASASARPP